MWALCSGLAGGHSNVSATSTYCCGAGSLCGTSGVAEDVDQAFAAQDELLKESKAHTRIRLGATFCTTTYAVDQACCFDYKQAVTYGAASKGCFVEDVGSGTDEGVDCCAEGSSTDVRAPSGCF